MLRAALILLFPAIAALGSGCRLGCFDRLDCTEGQVCGENGGCVPEAQDPSLPVDPFVPPEVSVGWDDPPGTWPLFVINQFAIGGKERGFDLDGDQKIDSRAWLIGDLLNDQLRQNLLGGDGLLLVELAGLDPETHSRAPRSVTVKLHRAADADEPYFPANNFRVPPGHTKCCEFLLDTTEASSRIPAVLEDGRLTTLGQDGRVTPYGIDLRKVSMSMRVTPSLDAIEQGLIGGAATMSSLAHVDNPFCKTVSPRCTMLLVQSSMLELASTVLGPSADIDLDGDGLECLVDRTGSGVYECCDGAGASEACVDASGACRAPIAGSLESCADRREIADGISTSFTFTALRAHVVGVR